MQEKEDFIRFLKQSGKKPHVVDGLVRQVEAYESWLREACQKEVQYANAADLQEYARFLDAHQPGSASKIVRGIALYYRFRGHPELAAIAAEIREAGTARSRRAFLLKDFQGVDPETIRKLAATGIRDVDQMLAAGKTPEARARLAEQTGVSPEAILELVKLSDLSRLGGLKGVRARLYYAAGADTLARIAAWEPEDLCEMLSGFVQRTGFPGTPPLPKEVNSTVAAARHLQPIVVYEDE